MTEPKFSDAPCYGKDYDARGRVCRVCLANKPCRQKVYRLLGASLARGASLLGRVKRRKTPSQPVLT